MKKQIITAVCGLFLAASMAAGAQVVVHIGPPAPIHEEMGVAPQSGWVHQSGYYRYDGANYVWVPGVWVAPPRPHDAWVSGHWRHQADGYVWVEGHWRG